MSEYDEAIALYDTAIARAEMASWGIAIFLLLLSLAMVVSCWMKKR